ncbi:hypothetical protein BD410DRAFT_886028 [Rickenella mellea]|uniref:Uncharacterized protein n=1 Tax=Rickenella mellea TaxID=50990 RepID=A0A4Y7PPX3_9AGAM|nr:hypothetical protein BD410DRAFT_886028 [Rickenella mellea]
MKNETTGNERQWERLGPLGLFLCQKFQKPLSSKEETQGREAKREGIGYGRDIDWCKQWRWKGQKNWIKNLTRGTLIALKHPRVLKSSIAHGKCGTICEYADDEQSSSSRWYECSPNTATRRRDEEEAAYQRGLGQDHDYCLVVKSLNWCRGGSRRGPFVVLAVAVLVDELGFREVGTGGTHTRRINSAPPRCRQRI